MRNSYRLPLRARARAVASKSRTRFDERSDLMSQGPARHVPDVTAVSALPHRTPIWIVVCLTLGSLVLAALLLGRPFLFQPFNIPAGSMAPTLIVGDYMFVSKYPYGYSRYSLPFSPPLFSGRIFGAQPQRGDVVVFRLPRDPLDGLCQTPCWTPWRSRPDDRGAALSQRRSSQTRAARRRHCGRSARQEMARNAAQWRELRNARHYRQRLLDNTKPYVVSAGTLFHARRQPRQFTGQPGSERRWLHSVREFDRPCRDHLLVDRRKRAQQAVRHCAPSASACGCAERGLYDPALYLAMMALNSLRAASPSMLLFLTLLIHSPVSGSAAFRHSSAARR